MHLVPKRKSRKKYNKLFVFLDDGSTFEYNLHEWKVTWYEGELEVEKLDQSEMDGFFSQSIVRIRFVNTDKKELAEKTSLKPIPPTAA